MLALSAGSDFVVSWTPFWLIENTEIGSTKEGRKEMFDLTTHSTRYIRLYGVRHMVKNHSDRFYAILYNGA